MDADTFDFEENLSFSFKAGCPSDLDCAAPQPGCPSPQNEPVPVNYQAKDFASRSLTDAEMRRYAS